MNDLTPHKINLSRMWELSPETSKGHSSSGKKLDWSEVIEKLPRPASVFRKFNCPTNLDAQNRLFLVFDACDELLECNLNETRLNSAGELIGGSQRFEVTALLGMSNRINVALGNSQARIENSSQSASVFLEIQ